MHSRANGLRKNPLHFFELRLGKEVGSLHSPKSNRPDVQFFGSNTSRIPLSLRRSNRVSSPSGDGPLIYLGNISVDVWPSTKIDVVVWRELSEKL